MATLTALQADVTRARAKLATASEAHYRAAQDAALAGRAADLSSQRKARETAQTELDAAIAQLVAGGEPATLLGEVPGDIPHLLLPLRIEARYVTTRHVARVTSLDAVVDVSTTPIASAAIGMGFTGPSYEVPRIEMLPQNVQPAARERALQVRSGQWFARKPDRDELWVRIYPDALFTEAFERDLQAHEATAGRAFWTAIFAGEEPFAAWQRLVDETDAPRAAWIVRALRPRNFDGTPSGTPQFPDVRLKDGAYTRAPVARLLPERFVVRLTRGDVVRELLGRTVPEPLPLGLDPLASDDERADAAMDRAGTTLRMPASVRWLHDLDAAEQIGLAIRVDLAQHPEFRDGIDSIVVLGVKLSAAPDEAQRMLAEHIENCVHKETGLGLLAQGTPTNATADVSKRVIEEADTRRWFDAVWSPERDPATDGSRLRRALGIAEAVPVPGGNLRDIEEAALINSALWPATLGYLFLQFMAPKMDEESRERVRAFFVEHVSGRGSLPVLRIDRQPYGILPTTSLDHWMQGPGGEREKFLMQLWMYVKTLDRQWLDLAPHVDAQIAAASASDRLDTPFLQMLGLSASSTQLDRDVLANNDVRTLLTQIQPTNATVFATAGFDTIAKHLELARLRLSNTSYPGLVDCFSSPADRRRIRMPFVARETSETSELPRLPGKGWNYLDWLAGASFGKLWDGDFSEAPAGDGAGEAVFDSVMARIARHALLRTFLEVGMHRVEPDPGLWLLRVRDFALERLHDDPITVQPQALASPLVEPYRLLVEHFGITAPFTLDPDRKRALAPVVAQLDRPTDASMKPISQRKAELARLARIPTARLERLFGEHLDLCSHRLDAWLLGVVSERLERQRAAQPAKLGLGAYGCLFGIARAAAPAIRFVEVAPETVPATATTTDAVIPIAHLERARSLGIDEKRMFVYLGEASGSGAVLDGDAFRAAPGTNTRQGHGYVHAPSSDHAAAAAVLFAAHASHGDADPMLAIDLESNRARTALGVLDRLQEGASLGELLGMDLERAMHVHGLDGHLVDVRTAFPLQASSEDAGKRTLATTDGLAVLEAARRTPPPAIVTAIAPAVEIIANTLDSVSDLLLAESVYQSTKGRPERAAAALRTLHAGGQVVAPEIVQSPTNGRSVHHRVAIVFARGEAPAASARGALAPDCNAWLASQLPDPTKVAVGVTFSDGTLAKVTLAELELQALDLVAAAPEGRATAAASPLAALVAMRVRARGATAGAITVEIANRRGLSDDDIALAEILPQLDAARRLLGDSRPLVVSDLAEPGNAAVSRVETTRISNVLQKLSAASGQLAKIAGELRNAAAEPKQAKLDAALARAWLHGIDTALLGGPEQGLDALARRAVAAADELDRRRAAGESALAAVSTTEDMSRFEALANVATTLLGPSARIFPEVTIETDSPFARAYADRDKVTGAGPGIIERWLHEASLARDHLRTYRRLVLLREALAAAHAASPGVVQLPAVGTPHPWIGGPFDAAKDLGTVSLVLELPEGFVAKGTATGILVDEWPELVPARVASTGVAFHVDQPDSEPPQLLLFAVSPDERNPWKWDHLVGAVTEMIRLAKRRLVTPALIEAHAPSLAKILPGLMLPVAPGTTQIPTVELT